MVYSKNAHATICDIITFYQTECSLQCFVCYHLEASVANLAPKQGSWFWGGIYYNLQQHSAFLRNPHFELSGSSRPIIIPSWQTTMSRDHCFMLGWMLRSLPRWMESFERGHASWTGRTMTSMSVWIPKMEPLRVLVSVKGDHILCHCSKLWERRIGRRVILFH